MIAVIIILSLLILALSVWVWYLLRENKELTIVRAALNKELQLTIETHQKQEVHQQKEFEHRLNMMMQQMSKLSETLLKERTQELSSTNRQQIETLLEPLRKGISKMEETMERTRIGSARNTERMEQQIRHVVETAEQLGHRADRLAKAIQGKNKMQGIMGESILARLLETMGLREGTNYTLQALLIDKQGRALRNNETDQRMIPDVLLHFPEGRDVVVDSKVSLKAYAELFNASSDNERTEALQRHVQSIKRHVDELARKRYADYHYQNNHMLPFVVMFVPYEGALYEALKADPTLWQWAFGVGVYIASEQTLYALLRLLEIAWQQQRQYEGQQQIMAMAKDMVERVGLFAERMRTVGHRIDHLRDEYDATLRTLSDGNRSILAAARRMTELGVPDSTKHPIVEQ